MRLILLLLLSCFFIARVYAQSVFLNEIRANDAGTDDAEFIELIGPAGMDLSGWSVVHYNGNGGDIIFAYTFASNSIIPDDGVTDGNSTNLGFVVLKKTGHDVVNADYEWGNTGLQNGPDGLELRDATDSRVQALTWNGLGDLSDGNPPWRNIGSDGNTDNSLAAPDSVQESLGKMWSSEEPTPGALNPGQTSGDISLPVQFSFFRAAGGDGIIYLYWRTVSEIDHLGFIIERGPGQNGPFEQIASYESDESLRGNGNTSRARNYRYIDRTVHNNLPYWYRLIDVDTDGVQTVHKPVCAVPSAKVKQIDTKKTVPHSYRVLPNYPNPFNPQTKIRFEIPEGTGMPVHVRLQIFNVCGQKITTLIDQLLPPGSYESQWTGRDDFGKQTVSGIYFLVFNSSKFHAVRRMLLIR